MFHLLHQNENKAIYYLTDSNMIDDMNLIKSFAISQINKYGIDAYNRCGDGFSICVIATSSGVSDANCYLINPEDDCSELYFLENIDDAISFDESGDVAWLATMVQAYPTMPIKRLCRWAFDEIVRLENRFSTEEFIFNLGYERDESGYCNFFQDNFLPEELTSLTMQYLIDQRQINYPNEELFDFSQV